MNILLGDSTSYIVFDIVTGSTKIKYLHFLQDIILYLYKR